MIINCAIIDDEPLAAGLLESYAQKTPYLSLTGTFRDRRSLQTAGQLQAGSGRRFLCGCGIWHDLSGSEDSP